MNYAEYLRRQTKAQSKIIGFKNGQDASAVTYKAQAMASSSTNFTPVAVTHSRIGGSIANIAVPSITTRANYGDETTAGRTVYNGVSHGLNNADRTAALIGAAVNCGACSDASRSEAYSVVLPCIVPLSTITNAPGVTQCCKKDYSQLFRNNNELSRQQGLQLGLRNEYNLPNKLQGLRGPVVNR